MKVGFFGGKFLPLHTGHLYAIAQSFLQVDKLYVVLSSGDNYDHMLCKRDGIKYMPPIDRLSWLGTELAKSYFQYELIHIEDRPNDQEHDWDYGAKLIRAAIPEKITHVFSSELEYDQTFSRLYLDAEHVIIDANRITYPISSTAIRRNPYNVWEFVPEEVKSFLCKKVCIVGTESCGKSTMTELLSKYYNTAYVNEVGRDYCETYSNQLTVPIFNNIAMAHWLKQEQLSRIANKVLFVDSEAIISQYYLDMYLEGEHSTVIDEVAKLQDYDLVLYLEPDVPWIADGVRFAGDVDARERNNRKLKLMYEERGVKFISVSGNYNERFRKSIELVNNLMGV